MNAPDTSFWSFSSRFYIEPDVAAVCLDLQDRLGADVNLLLFMLFLGERLRQVGTSDIAAIDADVKDWRASVIWPLRSVRRSLKAAAAQNAEVSTFRQKVGALELNAERMQQNKLDALLCLGAPCTDATRAASSNLESYLQFLGCPAEVGQALLESYTRYRVRAAS